MELSGLPVSRSRVKNGFLKSAYHGEFSSIQRLRPEKASGPRVVRSAGCLRAANSASQKLPRTWDTGRRETLLAPSLSFSPGQGAPRNVGKLLHYLPLHPPLPKRKRIP